MFEIPIWSWAFTTSVLQITAVESLVYGEYILYSTDLNNELQVKTNKKRNNCYLIPYSFSLAVACR